MSERATGELWVKALPRSNHNNILGRFEVQEFVEHIVTTCNHNRCVLLECGDYLLIEDSRLNLIGDKKEDNYY